MSDDVEPLSQTTLRLNVKLVGGTQGAAVAEAIDIRRTARQKQCVEVLNAGFDEAEVDGERVAGRIDADDVAQQRGTKDRGARWT